MTTKTGVSLEEYLRTGFADLDCEYVDGEIVERSVPEIDHGRTQTSLAFRFKGFERKFPLFPTVETRLRVSPTRVRIPDVSVFSPERPAGSALHARPYIVIEILSPDDRMADVLEKLAEYRALGVPHVWLADPIARRFFVYTGGLLEAPAFGLPEFGLEITPGEIFD